MFAPRLCFVGWFFAFICLCPAAHASDARASGFDPTRLQRLDGTIQHHIDQKQIAGGVMLVFRNGQPAHLRAYGERDIEAGLPMTDDTIFRIASMSKAITTAAVMMLYEEGRLLLRDPVSKYIPAFKNSVVAVPPPAGSAPEVKFVTEKARRLIQIRDLLTHTAGLTYGDGLAVDLYKKANLYSWYFADHDEPIGEAINRLATLPLHGHPVKRGSMVSRPMCSATWWR